jgi:serine/threonine protein kinase
MAPEMFSEGFVVVDSAVLDCVIFVFSFSLYSRGSYDSSCDIWSMGVVIYDVC